MRSWAGPTGQPACQLLPNSAAVTAVATALNVFAAIAVCFGIGPGMGGVALGAGAGGVAVCFGIGRVVGAAERVGVGVGLGVSVGVDVGVGVGEVAGVVDVAGSGDATPADGRAAAVAGDEAAGLAGFGAAVSWWPVVQAAQRTGLNAVTASSGSSGRPGRDREGPRRDTGTGPG